MSQRIPATNHSALHAQSRSGGCTHARIARSAEPQWRNPSRLSRRAALAAAVLALAGLVVPAGRAAAANGPAATIEAFYISLLAVMKEGKAVPFDQRYAQLAPAISRAFNLSLMTRIAVGPAWTGFAAAEQQQVEAAFTRYTIATYVNQFDGFSGERFTVDPNPVANPNGAMVVSHIVRAHGRPVTLDYLMRQGSGGQWRVIDVYLDGTISQLAARRAEFDSVLQSGGAAALVRLLDQRAGSLRAG